MQQDAYTKNPNRKKWELTRAIRIDQNENWIFFSSIITMFFTSSSKFAIGLLISFGSQSYPKMIGPHYERFAQWATNGSRVASNLVHMQSCVSVCECVKLPAEWNFNLSRSKINKMHWTTTVATTTTANTQFESEEKTDSHSHNDSDLVSTNYRLIPLSEWEKHPFNYVILRWIVFKRFGQNRASAVAVRFDWQSLPSRATCSTLACSTIIRSQYVLRYEFSFDLFRDFNQRGDAKVTHTHSKAV